MNIVFLDSIEKETYGGMEEWIRLVAEGLLSRNHNVTLVGRPGSKFLNRAGKNEKLNTMPLNISGDFNPGTISKLKSFIKADHTDILVTNFNKDVRLGGIAAKLDGNVKVVWSVGLDITKDRLIHKALTPKLVDKVIVPSESLKSEITRLNYIDKNIVDVIPIGIYDCALPDKEKSRQKIRNKYNLSHDAVISVTSGRLVEQKGHEYLIKAAPKIITGHPDIRFIFLGDGPLKTPLEKLIEDLNVQQYFIFAGMLNDVNEHLMAADIMIHPSRREPFGIAVLEGMRSGLPVVASRVGGLPEVVEEKVTALLAGVGNIDEIAECVDKILSSEKIMSEFKANARKRFENIFRFEMMIDKIENIFEKLNAKKMKV